MSLSYNKYDSAEMRVDRILNFLENVKISTKDKEELTQYIRNVVQGARGNE